MSTTKKLARFGSLIKQHCIIHKTQCYFLLTDMLEKPFFTYLNEDTTK